MTDYYYAVGTTLANLKNFEDIDSGLIAHSLQGAEIPFLPPNSRRVSSGKVVRNGAIRIPIQFTSLSQTQRNAFVREVFGDYETAGATVYITAIAEDAKYAPFLVDLDRNNEYERVNSTFMQNLTYEGVGWDFQNTTISTNTTITSSTRYVKGDTSGGNVTITLPAATSPNANTLFSFVKTDASNTLTIQRAGTDTIDGGTTVNITALNGRVDLYSDGTSAWTSI